MRCKFCGAPVVGYPHACPIIAREDTNPRMPAWVARAQSNSLPVKVYRG